jgi:hypothetical protein
VGDTIRPPAKIRISADYPAIAQAGRVEGIVIIEATIGVSGKVQDAKVLRSIPLLIRPRRSRSAGIHADAAEWNACACDYDGHRRVQIALGSLAD